MEPADLEELKLRVEDRRLQFQERQFDQKAEFRREELALKKLDLELTHGRSLPLTGAQATVLVALLALVSGALGSFVTGYYQRRATETQAEGASSVEAIRSQGQLQLENLKFEAGLILKAVDTNDQAQAVKALKFFAKAGLIPNHRADVLALAEKDDGVQVPALRSGGQCRFTKTQLSYAVSPEFSTKEADVLRAAFGWAFKQWAIAAGLTIVPGDEASADIIVKKATMRDVFGAIAYSQLPCDGGSTVMLSRTVDWTKVSGEPATASDLSLQAVVLHEAGHALGLAHVPAPGAVMSTPGGDASLLRLTDADIAELRLLYGSTGSGASIR